ncbi:GTPase [Myroides marinus]|uniref:GTPase n=1 Tax=Myroides marinus TaxID=703342 RepID=UPI002576C01E|nr:GTPase [Myroides marinus]MDM1369843.1 50S ribosome-binding GTPase [Myroides marinus]MDM1370762.1 50S ribosome-binding GTPase [Myroides marinus]MDM1531830.1 50S ribosome-binding GTPase [Myroides marinus]MDM1538746.1 50S ribosome-binding GTPase [Myroides marinus]
MFSQKDLENNFDNEYAKLEREIKQPNIFIIGKTGVGKSSLVNAVFGSNCANVSDSKPQTRGINRYVHNDVVLFDTEGLELDAEHESKFDEEIIGEIKRRQTKTEKEQIHLIWYLISASSDRITDYDIEVYQKLKSFNIPVAVVFTKGDQANEVNVDQMIKRLYPKLSFNLVYEDTDNPPFLVSNDYGDDILLSPEHIVNWSINKLPESLKYAFILSQKISLKSKLSMGESIVLQHTTGNAVVGFSPIPFSDAPILVLSQTTMLARIIKLYNIGGFDLTTFMKGSGASLVISNLGKSAVGSLLKFIPGLGTIAGGVINAGVAGAITYAMGTTMNKLLNILSKKVIEGNEAAINEFVSNFDTMFKTEFNVEYDNKRNEK